MYYYIPTQVSRKTVRPSTSSIRSADVATFVTSGWMPANPTVARAISDIALAGGYDENRTALIQDLQEDLSVFAHVIRSVGAFVDGRMPSVDPIEALTSLEPNDLRKLLAHSADGLSKHTLKSGSASQLRLLESTIVGGGSASMLADGAGMDKRVGFTAAILRNLGENLVAWNYPQAFGKITSQLRREGIDPSAEYERILGVSPQMISARLAREWRLSRELEQAVTGEDRRGASDARLASLSRICEIGEVFGRLNNPDFAEQAKRQLETVVVEVESVLGSNAIEVLKNHSAALQDKFIAGLPAEARDQFADKRVVVHDLGLGSSAFKLNLAAQKCPAALKDKLVEAYRLMSPTGVSQQSLKYLIDNCVTLAGFKRGCVYLWDNLKAELKPSLRIGDQDLKYYRPVKYQAGDALSESLFADNPISQHGGLLNGELVSYCAGSLGVQERVGVLLLVFSTELANSRYDDPLVYFRAIRGALNDFLRLK